jgi:hypothetical protein
MKKTIYLLNIGNYAPDITAITYPRIEFYARKIGAQIEMIDSRCFPEWDLDYEKLQIHQRAQANSSDWNIYIDSDALVHPELPDVTELIPRDTVAHNGSDFAGIRFRYDAYFQRDGRHIGSCNWLALASAWCIDLWHPLDDLTPDEATAAITPTVDEDNSHVTAAHLVSDYALSRNIARYGLKFTTLTALWSSLGLTPNFFWHVYTLPVEEKLIEMKKIVKAWGV